MDNSVNEKWLKGEISITREQMARIVAEEAAYVADLANEKCGEGFAKYIGELLLEYSARVCTRVFAPLEQEEELR